MDSPQGLLVVAILGLLSVGVQGHPCCHGRYVSSNIDGDINNLKVHLNLDNNKLIGQPVFLEKMKTLDGKLEHEQWLFWNATLSVYMNIFSKMLEVEKSEEVKKSLNHLRETVEKLKKHYYLDKMKMKIQELAAIEITDPVVQKKAVNEFREVFQEASKLGCTLNHKNATHS